MRIVLTILWVLSAIYATIPLFWLTIHPFAPQWRKRRGRVMPLLGAVWLVFIVIFLAASLPWYLERFYSTPWAWVPAAFLFAVAFSIYRSVSPEFTSATLVGKQELKPREHEQKLVTKGMHARMRHPFYSGHSLVLTALAVGSGLKVLFAMWTVAMLTGALMVRAEESELEQRFGEQYLEYKRRVPAVFPRF